jgi:hypothetical protein
MHGPAGYWRATSGGSLNATKQWVEAQTSLEMPPRGKLSASLRVNRPPGMLGEGDRLFDQPLHHRPRLPIRVLHNASKPAGTFDHRGHISFAKLLAEHDQIVIGCRAVNGQTGCDLFWAMRLS